MMTAADDTDKTAQSGGSRAAIVARHSQLSECRPQRLHKAARRAMARQSVASGATAMSEANNKGITNSDDGHDHAAGNQHGAKIKPAGRHTTRPGPDGARARVRSNP